jgi:hypothetical protein
MTSLLASTRPTCTVRHIERQTFENRRKRYVTPTVHGIAARLFPENALAQSPQLDGLKPISAVSTARVLEGPLPEHGVNMHCVWGTPSSDVPDHYTSVFIDGTKYKVNLILHTYYGSVTHVCLLVGRGRRLGRTRPRLR